MWHDFFMCAKIQVCVGVQKWFSNDGIRKDRKFNGCSFSTVKFRIRKERTTIKRERKEERLN